MKLLLKMGLIASLLPIGMVFGEVLHKDAAQYSSLISPMVIQTTTTSPTGARVHTTAANSGEALYEFELDEAGKFEVEALLFADVSYRNSLAVSVNSGSLIEWELTPNAAAYEWRKISQEFQGEAGIQQVRFFGREAYVRIAAVRINKIAPPAPQELLEVGANDAVVTPPMVLNTDPQGDYLSSPTNHQGEAQFTFLLLESSQVRLDLLAQGIASNGDSMYWKKSDGTLEAIHFGTTAEYKWKLGPTMNLEAGTHQIIIVGREANARLKSVRLTKLGPIPDPEPEPIPLATPAGSRFDSASNLTVINATSFADAATKALAAAPNSKIILPAGTFSGVSVTLRGTGSENAPIIIEGQPDGSTILTGFTKIAVKGSYVLLRNLNVQNFDTTKDKGMITFDACAYCGLHNSRFDTSVEAVMDSEGEDTKHFKTIRILPTSQSVEISKNSFINKRNAGSSVLVDRSVTRASLNEGHRIFLNLFLDRKLENNDANDFDSIRVGSSTESHTPSLVDAEALMTGANATLVGTTIEFNVFEGTRLKDSAYTSCMTSGSWGNKACKGEPELISVKAPQTIVRFNTFRNNSGGLTLRHGYLSIVEGNYFSGTNLPQNITTAMPGSYGIRVMDNSHLVLNNHMDNLLSSSSLQAGISILPGNTTSAVDEYWQVFDSIISGNFIKNVSSKPISFASDYGGRNKTILPERIVFSQNVVSQCSVATVNSAPDQAYLGTFGSFENLFDCTNWGTNLTGAVQIPLAVTALNGGFNVPNEASLVGVSGTLYNSEAKHVARLQALGAVSGTAASEKMSKLSEFLIIKRGSLYDNYLPQSRESVGCSF